MSNIFCGIGEIPYGKKRGSMIQCAKSGQIRYYGIEKVDPKIIEFTLEKKLKSSNVDRIQKMIEKTTMKIVGLIGRLKRFKRMLNGSKTSEDKKKWKKEIKTTEDERSKLVKQLEKYKMEKIKKSKKIKRLSRQSSRRKRTSKK